MGESRPSAPGVRHRAPRQEDVLRHDLLDFSDVRGLAQLFDRLNGLKLRGGADGPSMPFDPVALTRTLSAAIDRAREMRIAKTAETGMSASLDLPVIEEMLRGLDIPVAGGLLEVAAKGIRALSSGSVEYREARDRVLEQGKSAPVWAMPEEDFRLQYPEDRFGGHFDRYEGDEKQAAVRWQKIHKEERLRQSDTERDARDADRRAIESRVWEEHELTPYEVLDQDQFDHASVEALRGVEREDLERDAAAREHRGIHSVGVIRPYSLSASIQHAFTDGLQNGYRPDQYLVTSAINKVAEGRRESDQKEVAARVVDVPIGNGHSMRISILSDLDRPNKFQMRESPNQIRGAILESVGGFSLLDKEYPIEQTDRDMFTAAWKAIRAAEDRIEKELGIYLQLEAQIRNAV